MVGGGVERNHSMDQTIYINTISSSDDREIKNTDNNSNIVVVVLVDSIPALSWCAVVL